MDDTQRLRDLVAWGWTQRPLARALGVSQAKISLLLAGERPKVTLDVHVGIIALHGKERRKVARRECPA